MNTPMLLCYNLTGEREAKLRLTAMRFKLRLRPVDPAEYGQPLGALCGYAAKIEPAPTLDTTFTDEMLVLVNLPDRDANRFLQGLRQTRMPPIRLKAVLTPTNCQWDSVQLHHELSLEDEAFRQHETPVHQPTNE